MGLGYFLTIVTLGSVLGWLLHLATGYDYLKLLSRSVLLFAALGLVPLWRMAGLSVQEIGLARTPDRRWWLQVVGTFAVALAFVAPLMWFFVFVGFRVRDPDVTILSLPFIGQALWILFSAWLVGIFEETLFRGVLYTAWRRHARFFVAGLGTSALYSAVHFLAPAEGAVTDVHIFSGFAHMGHALGELATMVQSWDSALALFLLGVLFAWVREYLSLWHCIALHAAWVFALRIYKELTVRDIVNYFQPWTGDYDNFLGNLASVWLLFGLVCLALYRRSRPFVAAPQEN